MNSFFRLLRYAKPYRGRLAWAVLAMVVYAVASALVVYLIRPILDEVLPNRAGAAHDRVVARRPVLPEGRRVVFLRLSDGGRRAAGRDGPARRSSTATSSASRRAFSRATPSGSCCRACRTTWGRCSARSRRPPAISLRESLALVGYAVILFWIDWRLALVCLTGAPIIVYPLVRLGQRIRRTARRSQEAQEHMSHVGAETFAAHRIVKAFGAEEREASRFREALQLSLSHEHARRARAVA